MLIRPMGGGQGAAGRWEAIFNMPDFIGLNCAEGQAPTRTALKQPRGRFGGAEEDRTPDLRIANATLSQLSYGPAKSRRFERLRHRAVR